MVPRILRMTALLGVVTTALANPSPTRGGRSHYENPELEMTPATEAACREHLERNDLQKIGPEFGSGQIRLPFGFTSLTLNEFSKSFVDFVLHAPGGIVLDVGAGLGAVTLPALNKGTKKVIANDVNDGVLRLIHKRIIQEKMELFLPNLELIAGAFPEKLDFAPRSIGAIYIGAVLHFLDLPTIQRSLQKCFDWLAPGGRLFVWSATKHLGGKLAGLSGFISDLAAIDPVLADIYGPSLNLLDLPSYIALFKEAGFVFPKDAPPSYFSRTGVKFIESAGTLDQGSSSSVVLDGREYVGIVGLKP